LNTGFDEPALERKIPPEACGAGALGDLPHDGLVAPAEHGAATALADHVDALNVLHPLPGARKLNSPALKLSQQV